MGSPKTMSVTSVANAMTKSVSASSMASIDEDEDEKDVGMGLSLALLSPATSNHAHAKSADFAAQEEEEWVPSPRASFVGQSEAFKMSKTLKRRYLLENAQSAQSAQNATAQSGDENENESPKFVEFL